MPVPAIQNILYVTVIIGKPAKMKKESTEGYIYDHWPGAVSSTEIEAPTTEARDEEAAAENRTEAETRDMLPGFGSAHMFMPIPNSGTVVAAHCNWQFRYNYVENRIPRE